MSDIAQVRQMSDKELEDALVQARQELWSARFALSTRQLNDTSSIPRTRHTIARIMTVQRERGLGRSAAPAAATSGRASRGSTASDTASATKATAAKTASAKAGAGKSATGKAGAGTGKGK